MCACVSMEVRGQHLVVFLSFCPPYLFEAESLTEQLSLIGQIGWPVSAKDLLVPFSSSLPGLGLQMAGTYMASVCELVLMLVPQALYPLGCLHNLPKRKFCGNRMKEDTPVL